MWNQIVGTTDSVPLLLIRLGLGLVMFPHGAQKMLGWFGGHGLAATTAGFGQMGIPAPLTFLAVAAEFLGGLWLVLGFLSRIAAFGILCDMVVAVAKVHAANGFFMNWEGTKGREGFEFHVLAMTMALALMIGGAGALSLDRLLTKYRPARTAAGGFTPVMPRDRSSSRV